MDVLTVWKGKEVFEELAEIYGQLYLEPGEEGEQLYPEVVLKGRMPEVRKLDHFHMTDEDSCCLAQTPAGGVMVITLHDRRDFETFLQIMGKKCRRVDIPATQGASILDGVINHRKIEAHRDEFFRKAKEEGKEPDQLEWLQERSRFLEDKRNYRDALIILSVGPYSGVPADKAGFPEPDWLSISQTIRMYHECTHFVCRRLFPDKIDAIWDELAADAVGIYAALGRYDLGLAGTVLGIRDGKYTGGRLENYVPEDEPDQEQFIDGLLPEVLRVMEQIRNLSEEQELEPFELAVRLEKEKEALWKPEQA